MARRQPDRNSEFDDVLRRAFDKVAARDASDDQLDARRVAAVAAEVGLTPDDVSEAMVETRLGLDDTPGFVDRLVGPATVSATRVIDPATGGDDAVRDRTIEWLTAAHGLRPRVRADGVVVAERRGDIAGKVGNSLRELTGQGGGLGHADRIEAAVVSIVGGGSVGLAADVGNSRIQAITTGSFVALSGTVSLAVLAAVLTPFLLVAVPAVAWLGAVVSRRQHRLATVRVERALSQTVDGVVSGTEPPRLRVPRRNGSVFGS